MTVRLGF